MDPTLLELDLDKPAAKTAAAIVLADPAAVRDLDLTDDVKNPTCLECGAKGPVDDKGSCKSCYDKALADPAVTEASTDFADIAANAAANANAHLLANDANGRATLGVGFHNATGYLEALKRGVARATLSDYAEHLRGYGHKVAFEIAGTGYTMTVDGAAFTAPLLEVEAGNGYEAETHTNDAAIEAFKASVKAKKAKNTPANGITIVPTENAPRVRHLAHGDLVAGAAAEGHGILTAWHGAKPLTLGVVTELATAAGIGKCVPKAKEAKTQANLAVTAVAKEEGYAVTREKKKDLTKATDYDAKWTISIPATGVAAGESSGTVALVVTLTDGALKFDVEGELAEKIEAEFNRLVSGEILQAGHVTNWLGAVIRDFLGGVKYGGSWYIPRETRPTAEKVIAAFAPVWGTDWMNPPLPIATSAQLAAGIANGLAAEVDETVADLAKDAGKCKDGKVGEKAAVTYLGKFRAHGERVLAYAALLGDGMVASCKAKVTEAVAKLEGSLDGATIRYALAMEEAEADLAREIARDAAAEKAVAEGADDLR